MKLHTILTGYFKLDGGAMFGVVPKLIWNRLNPADENNLCNWAMRCLLVVDGDRRILIDTGIGNKQSEKFFGYYYLNGEETLELSLRQAGFGFEDITDVVLTHLHFDHVGGAVKKMDDGTLVPAFPRAVYHVTEAHLNHALNSNPREKASFLPENYLPLYEQQRLHFVKAGEMLTPGMEMRVVNRHTTAMITPMIRHAGREMVYCADLIPSASHIPVNYVMGYDNEPLVAMKEKQNLFELPGNEQRVYYFEHDPATECAAIAQNEKGGWQTLQRGALVDFGW